MIQVGALERRHPVVVVVSSARMALGQRMLAAAEKKCERGRMGRMGNRSQRNLLRHLEVDLLGLRPRDSRQRLRPRISKARGLSSSLAQNKGPIEGLPFVEC